MPLTLEKLFSPTVESSFSYDGEIVHLTWAPARYTGEMDDFAASLSDDETADTEAYEALLEAGDTDGAAAVKSKADRRTAAACRRFVAQMLVAWDVLDGKVAIPFDEEALKKLPDIFITAVFNAMSEENQTDPTNAPSSDASSKAKASSERSPRGTSSSGERKRSTPRRGK